MSTQQEGTSYSNFLRGASKKTDVNLKNFFSQIYRDKKYIKLFVTRRAYVLYKLYEKELNVNHSTKNDVELFNSNSMCLIEQYNNHSDKNILLVDDIILNGRTIEKHFNFLSKALNYPEKNIKICCLMINNSASRIEKYKQSLIDGIPRVSETIWREYSNDFNSIIVSSLFGYVSYIQSYKIQLADNFKNQFLNSLGKYYSYKNLKHDVELDVIFLDEICNNKYLELKEFGKSLSKFNINACIRFYNNTEADNKRKNATLTMIPYVFMPNIKIEDFTKYITDLLYYFGVYKKDNNSAIFSIISRIRSTNNLEFKKQYICFVYKWVSNLLSKKIKELLSAACETSIEMVDLFLCEESFKDIGFPNINCQDNNKNISYEIQQVPYGGSHQSCIDELNEVANKFSRDAHNFSEKNKNTTKGKEEIALEKMISFLSSYLYRIRTKDQDALSNTNYRLIGICTEDIILVTKSHNIISDLDDNILKKIIYFALIYEWDIGEGSSSPNICDTANNPKIISNFTINGEQIYRYPLEKYKQQIIYDFQCFYHISGFEDLIRLRAFARKMDELLQKEDYISFIDDVSDGIKGDFGNAMSSLRMYNFNYYSIENHNEYIRDIYKELNH